MFSFLLPLSLMSCTAGAKPEGNQVEKEQVAGEQETKESAKEDISSEESITSSEGKSFEGKELVITGSTTLLQVSEAWASAFMEKYGGTVIVNGGGSGEGIAALINGTTDLANSSREIKGDEIEAAISSGLDIQEYLVLYDGVAVVVHPSNPVEELTIEQLSKMYTGEITNWSEVGGKDKDIILAARDSSSGTGEYFLEEVVQLGKTKKENDYSPDALRLQSNADVVNQVSTTENAIGYIGLGYIDESVKVLKIRKNDSTEGVLASVSSVKDGSYPISRGLYIYASSKNLSEIAKAYLDFVMSEEGQAIGLKNGFVPVK
ncbi:MAG: phosphate ABC transporter substrate-binding protein [Actinobacteria bacterium]|nr:phosphate ABC transporter substrate-binding protein [Actinomycetota bacterium]